MKVSRPDRGVVAGLGHVALFVAGTLACSPSDGPLQDARDAGVSPGADTAKPPGTDAATHTSDASPTVTAMDAAAGPASAHAPDARSADDTGAERDAGSPSPTRATPQIPPVPLPTIESESFSPSGSITDIADDSAIYANPTAPELSVVIADNKDDATGGVGVFDMQGKQLQLRQDGKIGNVDLRTGFPFMGRQIVLVGANNRTSNTLMFWQLDATQRRLSAPIGDATVTVAPNYGFCLYHSAKTGSFYAFVTQETGKSTMEQYLLGERDGHVTATKVRAFDVGSITEGCVADDELGRLYVAQEDVALWRYDAEPSGGSTRVQVAAVGDGHVVADLEGVGLAEGEGTSGYLVVSLQSESRFVTFDRESNQFMRTFSVGAKGSIDAVSQTDGLSISTSNLGPGFPKGALVVHDGSNAGGATSNLKYVPLE